MQQSAALEQLRTQWDANQRLRLGVWLLAVILLGYCLVVAGDWRKDVAAETRKARGRLAELQQTTGEHDWAERAGQARRRAVDLEQGLRQAETRALAQADLQSWFTGNFGGAEFVELRTTVATPEPVDGLPGVWRVRAEMRGAVPRAVLLGILRKLELDQYPLAIERLDYQPGGESYRLELEASAFYFVPASAGAG